MAHALVALILLAVSPPDDARVLHVLSRLTWGPRQGDVERVRATGVEAWLDQQLEPSRIPDQKLDARLASLATADLSTAELRRGYEVPKAAKKELKARQAALGANPTEDEVRAARREMFATVAPKMAGRPQEVVDELQEARLLRAVYTERQLADVVSDFWFNHFNVYAGKGPARYLIAEYEREAIRPHALGRFEDLLRATARSPAMLVYLDNWMSAAPDTDLSALRRDYEERAHRRGPAPGRFGFRPPKPDEEPRTLGLNENYARELMELHTLGVDGGYTQKDVAEVARCFTGWSVRGLRRDGERPEFAFVPLMHAGGDKVVLGQRIPGGGQDEGERVLHILATHPATARFIATKLARRFVADEPPAELVERMADAFRRTQGDTRAVIRTMALSPEFDAPATRGAKTKTPLEFAVSALRATGAEVRDAREVARRLDAMGTPLYMQQPPTGYKDTAAAWVSSASLVARLGFALDLAANRLVGAQLDASTLARDPADASALADTLGARLMFGAVSDPTRETIAREAGESLDAARVAGLLLGSPEFQRR